jgi:hypothetical protein
LAEINASDRVDILNGWKEISSYLRMGVRTVQRYEEFGLPVRRPGGRRRGSVFATKAELDAWIIARPARDISRLAGFTMRVSGEWADFKAGIAEMKRLRAEMIRLRTDAVASLENLRGRVLFIQGVTGGKLLEFPNVWHRRRTEGLESDSISKELLFGACEQEAG